MSEYIFCVDSDGCAMDTMTYKHEMFFGPIAATKFNVTDNATFQENWENINLYSRTRGVNRFVGLVMGLESVGYEGIEHLTKWVNETKSLSNDSLVAEIEKNPSEDLELALEWSQEVNKQVSEAEGHDKPFPGAREGLEHLSQLGDVFVVSSANREAVEDEWTRHGLIEYVNDLYCQDRGKKADVIAGFIKNGQAPERIMMVGDSPGDLEAAEKNGTKFYPIIVGDEEASWSELTNQVADEFVVDKFTDDEQQALIDKFWANLDK